MKVLSLQKFIEQSGGAVLLAEKLNITPHCVRIWARGEGVPRVKIIAELVRLSKGRLTPGRIFEECSRNKGKKRIRCKTY